MALADLSRDGAQAGTFGREPAHGDDGFLLLRHWL
jgi:hypothetical protein